ncbi:hypothetical protein [Nocardia sp. NPDC005745]|uniref:hypothetical protein n=1 Tax=Nocardia sp. NPDC005745 TaxID=3157061 RepID=UPI0033DF8417
MGDKEVQDAVDLVNKENYVGYYDGNTNFANDEDKKVLEALAGLSSGDFEKAFNKLDDEVRRNIGEDADEGLRNDPKYKDLIYALNSGDPKNYVDTKRTAEQTAETPQFANDWKLDNLPDEDEGKHAEPVKLPIPKGASAQLVALIKDTEFTMQWGFDTLGIRNPKDAPDFTNVLDDEHITSGDGWSEIKKQHGELGERLEKRKTEYKNAHKDVKFDTFDTKVIKDDTFRELVRIKDDLVADLKYEPTNTTHTGNQITESSGGRPENAVQVPVYEKNTDKDSEGYNKFYLTAEAEQRYYVRSIDMAAEEWDKVYAEKTDKFQKKAEDIDHKNDNNNNNDNNSNKNANNNNNNNNANNNNNTGNPNNGNNNTYVPPTTTGNTSTQQPGATNDDWSSTYDDLIDGSTDTSATETGTGTQPISDSGSVDTSSSGAYPGATQAGLQTGTGIGTGSGTTGTNTGSVAPATNTGDNGMANAMQQMAMMSALSGMNQGNRQPDDDRAYDRTAERERREERERERERNRNAQPATANQAVQQTAPPGVTAPTYAGAPPAVTTPGMTPGVRIGDTMVNASPPVAEALQKQTQNVALDAVSAYKGTAGEITAEHPPAVVNGPGELKTGDILQWEKFSALVVRNPNGMDGLFVLDGGQLIPLDPNNPPLTEKYGNFTGYIHPTGLDTGSNTADPGATAPPPPTLSTAQPSGPPPVGPPPQV